MLGLILVLQFTPVSAEEPATVPAIVATTAISIEALQRLGLEANGLVHAARSQVGIAESGVISASAYPNPQVSMMGGPQNPRILAANPANSIREVGVVQPIENPFMRSARIGAASAGVEANRASLNQVRADLAAQLRVRAFELLQRQEVAHIEAEVFDLMDDVRRRIKLAVEVGETARFELIRVDAEVLNAAGRKEAAQLNAQRARVMLRQLTAGALKLDFELSATLRDPVKLPALEVLREEVPAANPEILRLQAEQERTKLRISQERAAIIPSVDILLLNYQDAQYTENRAGLRVTVPLLYQRRGEINAAIFDSARVRETLEYRVFEVGQLLESAWQGYQIAQRRVEMFEGGIIREAELAFQVARTAHRFGERGLIEVLDSQRILRGILVDSLLARFELQAAAAEIDRLRAHYPKE